MACWGNDDDEGIGQISDVTGFTDGSELMAGEEMECDFGENREGADWWNWEDLREERSCEGIVIRVATVMLWGLGGEVEDLLSVLDSGRGGNGFAIPR